MTELVWFLVVGFVAVACATAMLLSDNAVHSALFLVGTMGCIAFLFLLLNAPFLAMVQITVYTGAIMVLFLFVIMLLGAERLKSVVAPGGRSNRWYAPLAWGLVAALFLIVGIVLVNVDLNLQENPGAAPQVRVVNAAPDAGAIDVYANDELVAENVVFSAAPVYVTLPAGDTALRVEPENGASLTLDVALENGAQHTLVEYSAADSLSLSLVADDNSTVESRSTRLTFFNAYPGAVRIVDFGSEFDDNDTTVVLDNLEPGAVSEPLIWGEGVVSWAFVDAANESNVLYRLNNYNLQRDTSELIVLTQERIADGSATGTLRLVALPVTAEARPSFGGPHAIGLELFTNYVLVFQLLALLLLAAMVGAIVLTHRELKPVGERVGGRRRVSRPLVNVIAAQVGHEVTGERAPELQEPPANAAPASE